MTKIIKLLLVTFITFSVAINAQEQLRLKENLNQNQSCSIGSSKNILFIGNSYTYYNDLPKMFFNMATASHKDVCVESSTQGGGYFKSYFEEPEIVDSIQRGIWDIVILQNQSQIPGHKPDVVATTSVPNAKKLVKLIKKYNKAKIIYFQTWGREHGDSRNCPTYTLVCTFGGHSLALRAGYQQYADSTGGSIAPVGNSWVEVVNDSNAPFPSGELWRDDSSHPEVKGTYLAASVFYRTIFLESPIGNSFTPVDLSESHKLYLQELASRTW